MRGVLVALLAALSLAWGAPTTTSAAPDPAQAMVPRRASRTPRTPRGPVGTSHLSLVQRGRSIARTARAYLGYRYAYRGDTPWTGFSCIGFAHWVYRLHGISIPESLGAAYRASPHVARWALQPGDLLYFADTVWPGLSHVEVYVGRGWSVGADNVAVGVHLNNINAPYWRQHYMGATRPLAGVW